MRNLHREIHPSSASIAGVIPARWGSTRFPGKSLAPICGKPLIQWVMERARQARSLSSLWVATDDERIRSAVLDLGGQVVMTRSDHPSGTDRIAEAVKNSDAEVVINIQGDEPLIDPVLIDLLGTTLAEDPSWDMATAACPISDPADLANPSVVKVVWGAEGQALYFSRSIIPFVRDPEEREDAAPVLHWRHIGIYAYRRTFLEKLVKAPVCRLERAEKLEQLRALYLGCRMKVLPAESFGWGVDTPDDIAKAEEMLKRLGLA
ncbi:MAG: 3-deoxy-manno-octulosonate cytidylyltransferase [Lentisphaerota bacterium]